MDLALSQMIPTVPMHILKQLGNAIEKGSMEEYIELCDKIKEEQPAVMSALMSLGDEAAKGREEARNFTVTSKEDETEKTAKYLEESIVPLGLTIQLASKLPEMAAMMKKSWNTFIPAMNFCVHYRYPTDGRPTTAEKQMLKLQSLSFSNILYFMIETVGRDAIENEALIELTFRLWMMDIADESPKKQLSIVLVRSAVHAQETGRGWLSNVVNATSRNSDGLVYAAYGRLKKVMKDQSKSIPDIFPHYALLLVVCIHWLTPNGSLDMESFILLCKVSSIISENLSADPIQGYEHFDMYISMFLYLALRFKDATNTFDGILPFIQHGLLKVMLNMIPYTYRVKVSFLYTEKLLSYLRVHLCSYSVIQEVSKELSTVSPAILDDISNLSRKEREAWEGFLRQLKLRDTMKKRFDYKNCLYICAICQSSPDSTDASSHLFSCSGCKKIFYCSRKCQKKDWKGTHRNTCRIIRHFTEEKGHNDGLPKKDRRFLQYLILHEAPETLENDPSSLSPTCLGYHLDICNEDWEWSAFTSQDEVPTNISKTFTRIVPIVSKIIDGDQNQTKSYDPKSHVLLFTVRHPMNNIRTYVYYDPLEVTHRGDSKQSGE